MEPFQLTKKSFLTIESWKKIEPNLQVGFTTRQGGTSDGHFQSLNLGLHVPDNVQNVIRNRKLLAGEVNMTLDQWVSGEQVHGTKVALLHENHKGKGASSHESSIAEIDGLITNEKGMLCTAFFADCVPVFFFDEKTGYIGIAHAGWKGTVGGICTKMVEKLVQLGVDVRSLRVAIGPSISQDNYEVDEKVIENLTDKQRITAAKKMPNQHYQLDLKTLNSEILLQSGVLRHNISITNYCTHREEALFFSHRRDRGKTGRMLGFIGFQS
ncbi:peptidoglycan editing factor PgeF [Virgibacillus flavescens]|uniref:peptidoglycan editing factor PgeF n=1 Tax=Virgibacillus flavescens TaxID=1611422 RepID=UPI003D33FCC1